MKLRSWVSEQWTETGSQQMIEKWIYKNGNNAGNNADKGSITLFLLEALFDERLQTRALKM